MRLAMVMDVVRMVAVVVEAAEDAEVEVAAHEVVGAPWWAPEVVAHKRKRHKRRR
jgi:hypothetical protein